LGLLGGCEDVKMLVVDMSVVELWIEMKQALLIATFCP